jgi:hypothetical protein
MFESKISLGLILGATFVGFFLSTNTILISGLLESSKEWCLSEKKFEGLMKEDIIEGIENIRQKKRNSARLAGYTGIAEKDTYIYY